jgi:IS30 family transposase
LTLADREEITLGVHAGQSCTVIAARLGKATSTVSREVAANGGRVQYRAWRAHQRACEQARRPKTLKLTHPPLAERVSSWLAQWWSPQQISARLRIEFPGDPMMRVSHETIYQGPVRAGPRRAAPRAGPLPAHRASKAPPAGSR